MTLRDCFIDKVLSCTEQADSQDDASLMQQRSMKRFWHPTRNGTMQLSDVSPGSSKRLWWQCEQGHEWQAVAYSIAAGTACPYCAGKQPIVGKTDLATTHPELAEMWSEKNKLSPRDVTAGSHKRVLLVCEQGHEWETRIESVALLGSGCPYCAGRKAIPGETDLKTLRPDLMEQWDFEKNTADPGKITLFAHDKVWWKCELGHSYGAIVFSRTKENGSGCPYCTGRLVLSGFNDLATVKPKLAEQWYQPLNGELTPGQVTLGSNKKVWWRCGEGHVWQAAIYSRTRRKASGCPVCAGVTRKKGAAAAAEEPKSATRKHRTGVNHPGNHINVL